MQRSELTAMRPILLEMLRALPEHPAEFRTQVEALIGGGHPDRWEHLRVCATQHGVTGVIDAALSDGITLPSDVAATITRRRAIAEIWHAHARSGLRAAIDLLHHSGIRVCALKGPSLAARLYPAGATRHSFDLDLLVDPGDLDRAVEVFTRAGYAGDAGITVEYLRRYGHHVHLARARALPIELHFRAYAGFGVRLPSSELLDRAGPFRFDDGGAILAPAPEDEFLYLATHAAGHSFIRLMWLYDLKLLVLRYPSLNWTVIAARADALGVRSAVDYAVRLLRAWLGMFPPTAA